ncbi:hypothetical protein GJ496_005931 [Pomphorhynchus laevis]|nr:hypothetical protein GJ496_005931 [Pomphorhynchus laevis]
MSGKSISQANSERNYYKKQSKGLFNINLPTRNDNTNALQPRVDQQELKVDTNQQPVKINYLATYNQHKFYGGHTNPSGKLLYEECEQYIRDNTGVEELCRTKRDNINNLKSFELQRQIGDRVQRVSRICGDNLDCKEGVLRNIPEKDVHTFSEEFYGKIKPIRLALQSDCTVQSKMKSESNLHCLNRSKMYNFV